MQFIFWIQGVLIAVVMTAMRNSYGMARAAPPALHAIQKTSVLPDCSLLRIVFLLWRNPCRELRWCSWGLHALCAFCPRCPGIPHRVIKTEGQRELSGWRSRGFSPCDASPSGERGSHPPLYRRELASNRKMRISPEPVFSLFIYG
jgi:hypothetical protein